MSLPSDSQISTDLVTFTQEEIDHWQLLQTDVAPPQFQASGGFNFDAALRDDGPDSLWNLFPDDNPSETANKISALFIDSTGDILTIGQHVRFELYA
jgi:hypothetical protein